MYCFKKCQNNKDMMNDISEDSYSKETWDDRSITYSDYGKILNRIVDDIGNIDISPQGLHQLYLLISRCKKVDSRWIPDDIVTLNSEVIIITDEKQKCRVRIVIPKDSGDQCDVSVYSPLGIACLGARESTCGYIPCGNTRQKVQIEKLVFQPEKEKQFFL
jgi:regulator of nucleoside diphosphate kinase